MIIQLEGAATENLAAARQSLDAVARSCGHEIAETLAEATTAGGANYKEDKGIDPVSVASLMLSIPPSALARLDLADRIRKRRRGHSTKGCSPHPWPTKCPPGYSVSLDLAG
jgi:hypothetical protein